MTDFKDHFSGHAAEYAAHRPHYPEPLFRWLADLAPGRQLAWDCATGNGQAALALSKYFDRVVATDASAEQIAQAPTFPGVDFRVEPAEKSSLHDASVDLISVAQALHWFDHSAFVREAGRVSVRGAVLAAWTYGLAEIEPGIDSVVRSFYEGPIAAHWPPERRWVDSGYRDIHFPWPEVSAPGTTISLEWDLERLMAYLGTWSAVKRYRASKGTNPLERLRDNLAEAWGPAEQKRSISWPISIRAFRLP